MGMDSTQITHGESLWEMLDVLRDSGSHGAKTCLAMASFLRERAAVENAYGEVRVLRYLCDMILFWKRTSGELQQYQATAAANTMPNVSYSSCRRL